MKKNIIYNLIIIFSFLSFAFTSCSFDEGVPMFVEDSINGAWLCTGKYTVVNGYVLNTNVSNGSTYTFAYRGVLTIETNGSSISGDYTISKNNLSYIDEDGTATTKKFSIEGDRLYLYTSVTDSTGSTFQKGIILTKESGW